MPNATTNDNIGCIANILFVCGASFVILAASGATKNHHNTAGLLTPLINERDDVTDKLSHLEFIHPVGASH